VGHGQSLGGKMTVHVNCEQIVGFLDKMCLIFVLVDLSQNSLLPFTMIRHKKIVLTRTH